MDINQDSKFKKWIGFKDETGMTAKFAILVDCKSRDGGGVEAYVYCANKRFSGDSLSVTKSINEILEFEYVLAFGEIPETPKILNGKLKISAFITAAYQAEKRESASGELFLPHRNQDGNLFFTG